MMLYSCTHTATVGIKGLTKMRSRILFYVDVDVMLTPINDNHDNFDNLGTRRWGRHGSPSGITV